MRFRTQMMLSVGLVLCLALAAGAQEEGRRGRGGGFGGGGGFTVGRLALLRIEAVQKELDLTPDQVTAIQKLQDELRPMRGGGEGNQPRRRGRDNNNNNDAGIRAPGGFSFVQQDQPRRQISDEDRERFRQQAEERAKKEREELAKILKPEQLKRLNEIYIRLAGTAALSDAEVAKELEISDEQRQKIRTAREEAFTGNREEMRELFQSGDREKIQAKMTELRKAADEKVLAVLSDAQKKKFEDMKGKPFELPEGALRGGFGRGGNRPDNN